MSPVPKITVHTQVYNTPKEYLEKCINSILNQTFRDFEYCLIDNGCNEETSSFLTEFSKRDSRINLIRFDDNDPSGKRVLSSLANNTKGEYAIIIDSDDWFELECFERMVSLIEKKNYDIVVSGNYFHYEKSKRTSIRKLEQPISMTDNEYQLFYEKYYNLFRTLWGKLYKINVAKKAVEEFDEYGCLYGMDTHFAFLALRHSKNVYIDNSAFYHYRVYDNSISYFYSPERADSDIILFNNSVNFLSQYGEISDDNLFFIHMIYISAVRDTIEILFKSNLSHAEKLDEIYKIFERQETKSALLLRNEKVEKIKNKLIVGLLSFATEINNEFDKVLQILNILSPACSPAVNKETIKLFSRNNTFKALLVNNDKKLLTEHIQSLILKGDKLVKVYNFSLMLGNLASENSLAKSVKSTEFIKLYTDVYNLIWNENNTEALDKMVEILFSGNELNCPEEFLNLFVTLAALENHIEAFLFGNIQKAYLFIDQKRFDEAKVIVNDLVEMGMSESEDVIKLQKILDK